MSVKDIIYFQWIQSIGTRAFVQYSPLKTSECICNRQRAMLKLAGNRAKTFFPLSKRLTYFHQIGNSCSRVHTVACMAQLEAEKVVRFVSFPG